MTRLKINIIGCGRLGRTLGALFAKAQILEIGGILNANLSSSQEALEFIGSGKACASLQELPPAELTLIATPDAKIEDCANALSKSGLLQKGQIVFHCSGTLSSDALASTKTLGCLTASVHPLKSFANPAAALLDFAGSYCSLEGDESLKVLEPLFKAIGAKTFVINKEDKILYHAASVMANNYAVALYHQAQSCFEAANIKPEIAKELTQQLMQGALNNLKSLAASKALTGPIQRGDLATIEKHLSALSKRPELMESYCSLGKATLALTQHPKELLDLFMKAFNEHA